MAIHNVKSEIETGKSAKQIFSDNFNSEQGELSVRRVKRKLTLFYDIVSGQSPDYLQDLSPITVGQTNT
jgi:hypothetical protein